MDIDGYIKSLSDTINEVKLHYDIWDALKQYQAKSDAVKAMNAYPLFFLATMSAHFKSYVVGLYRLFETRQDTVNIPGLLKRVEAEGTLTPEVADELRQLQNNAKPLWIKIGILRNESVGHQTSLNAQDAVFGKALICPQEVESLIAQIVRAFNAITHARSRSIHAFNLSAAGDTKCLLDKLIHNRSRTSLDQDRLLD